MYAVVTDTCIDLNPELLQDFENIDVLPLSYTVEGKTSTVQLTTPEMVHEFYDKLRAGLNCTTSQVTPGQFYEVFLKYAKAKIPVLGVIFAAILSGTYASAVSARDMVLDEIPDAVIELVDSKSATVGQGMLVLDAIKNREAGMPLEDNVRWVEENRGSYRGWITVDDLNFLKRGGRCSPSSAFFGTLMKIKPIITLDEEGRVIAKSKVRGRAQAIKTLVDKYKEQRMDPSMNVFISHCDCPEDAQTMKDLLVKDGGADPEKIVICPVGPVIGVHLGPGGLTVFFRAAA